MIDPDLNSGRTRKTVLRIRHVYPGSVVFQSRILGPNFSNLNLGSASMNLSVFSFYPKKWFLSTQTYDPGCSSPIRIRIFLTIPEPGSRIRGSKLHRIPDPQHCLKKTKKTQGKEVSSAGPGSWLGFGTPKLVTHKYKIINNV